MRLSILLLAAACAAGADDSIKLFNGRDLSGFYTYLDGLGADRDPDRVFSVRDGAIRISGQRYGYICTRREFDNFYLDVEFKWGEETWPPRVSNARDSGILFHVTGEDKVWPRSIEFQMIEGGTGDIILVGGTELTVKGERRASGRFDRFGKGPWKDLAGYRDPSGEVEKPRGEWNRLELWAQGDRVRMLVNGKLVNEGAGASVQKGKILFQSEGAEVFIRKVELRSLPGRDR